jgi:hypothetical protein
LGLDPNDERDLFQQMDNVARHYLISSTEFRAWADMIEEDAKIICNDPRGERIRFVITEKSGRFTIDVGKADASTFACIIKAIRQNFDGMPDNLSMWYMVLLRYLEIQAEKSQIR